MTEAGWADSPEKVNHWSGFGLHDTYNLVVFLWHPLVKSWSQNFRYLGEKSNIQILQSRKEGT